MSLFVQLGATRDGLDPYLQVAHAYGMQAVLVETPDYIELRKGLGRKTFDHTLAVTHPAGVEEVLAALQTLPEPPTFVLAGFERYIYTAYALAHRLHIPPSRPDSLFFPPNKAEQREMLARCSSVTQPNFRVLEHLSFKESNLAGLSFPLVLKPVDGGGGLGVFLVATVEELHLALVELAHIFNYDGGAFAGFVVEEFLPGTEFSIQGIVHAGKCDILTQCQKFVTLTTQYIKDHSYLRGFKEVGHMAINGRQAPSAVHALAQECMHALGYTHGPFHMDMVFSQGNYSPLEIGFRLSGSGLARIVQRVSGRDWAVEAFTAHLDGTPTSIPRAISPPNPLCIGQITAVSLSEISRAYSLQAQGHHVEVQRFASVPIPIATSLHADLTRHGDLLGRIVVSRNTLREVERMLRHCAPERTFSSNVSTLHHKKRTSSMSFGT